MMAVLHKQPETAREPKTPLRGHCPECMGLITAVQPRQLFCSAEHKAAFHNRATVRGRVLTPLVMADRITRGGSAGDVTTGRRARRDAQRLIDSWARDDREAKRMSMVDYVCLRLAKGFELP